MHREEQERAAHKEETIGVLCTEKNTNGAVHREDEKEAHKNKKQMSSCMHKIS